MTENETHPWKLYAPKNSTVLFVGTFPPAKKRWSYDFFYPNKANLFWQVMSKVAGTELRHFSGAEAIEERKGILDNLSVAITDMGLEISRTDNSSLDENIAAIQFMDILQILIENPKINKVIFTSSSGPTSAARWFIEYLKTKNIIHKFPKGTKPVRSEIKFENRLIQLVILFSPSRRAANRISLEELTKMYAGEIAA